MATYYKRDSGTNWNSAASWSTVAYNSATNTGTFPVAGDTALFVAGSSDCSPSTAVACAVVDFTGYTGTFTLGNYIQTTGNVTFSSGMTFTPGTNVWRMGCNGVTLTTAGKSFYDLNFNVAGTITLADALDVTNTLQVGIGSSNITIATSDITCKNLSMSNGAPIVGTGRTITMTDGTWSGGGSVSTNLTMLGSCTLTGTVKMATQTLNSGAATLTTTGSTLDVNGCTINDNTNIFDTIVFSVGSGSSLTLATDVTCNNLTHSSTQGCTLETNNIIVKGNLRFTSTGSWIGRTITMTGESGTATWSCSSTGRVNSNLIFLGGANTITVSGNVYFGGTSTPTLTYTSGTIVLTGSTLNIAGSCTLTDATNTWVNIAGSTIGTATLTLSQDTTISGNLTIGGYALTIASNNIYVQGNLTLGVAGIVGQTIFMTGNVAGTATWSSSGGSVASNITFQGGANTITVSGNVYKSGTGVNILYTSGTMVLTGSTLNIGASCTFTDATNTWNNINCRATSTLTLSQATTISGNLTVNVTSQTFTIAGNDINVGGDVTTVTGAGISGTTRTITMTGTSGTATWSASDVSNSPVSCILKFDAGENTITVGTNVWKTGGAIIYASGTLVTTGSTLNVVGSFTFTDATNTWNNLNCASTGTLTLSQATTISGNLTVDTTKTLTISGNNITVGGNITVASTGVLACGTNTITVNGNIINSSGSATTWRTGTNTFVLNGNTRITGSSTFSSLTINAGKTVSLTSTQTFTVSGTFTANGSAGSLITLKATTGGSQAKLNVTTVGTVNYVKATDIDSSGGSAITEAFGVLVNTINWTATARLNSSNFFLVF